MKIKYLSILPVIAVIALSGISLAHAQVFTDNLYYGIHDKSQVSQLQEFLTSQGLYSGPISGNFYFLTLSAVKSFQTQQGITPAAGYFGPVTMAAANNIADAAVGASNNEAISETGTSTPPIQSSGQSSNTPQLQLTALLQEVALLQQELTTQQSSTKVLQQIAQNTTPPITTVPTPTLTQPQGSIPAPTASITVNGSANSITIPYNTATTISWSSTNANSCSISPAGWSGTSGNRGTGNLTTSQTYFLSCTGAGSSASASLTVSVSAAPVPTPQITFGKAYLSGYVSNSSGLTEPVPWSPATANLPINIYTGIPYPRLCIVLLDQNGNPIINASATVTIDGSSQAYSLPNYSGADCNYPAVSNGEDEYVNTAGYEFGYTAKTDGQHIITVSALGSTQSVTVTSQTPSPVLGAANASVTEIPISQVMPNGASLDVCMNNATFILNPPGYAAGYTPTYREIDVKGDSWQQGMLVATSGVGSFYGLNSNTLFDYTFLVQGNGWEASTTGQFTTTGNQAACATQSL